MSPKGNEDKTGTREVILCSMIFDVEFLLFRAVAVQFLVLDVSANTYNVCTLRSLYLS